jgi:cytochrome bd-type quinol oxidase subunit 1
MPVINTQHKQKWVAVTVFYFYSGQQGGIVQEVMMVLLWGTKSKCEGRFFC